jgi:hypothetical protein
VEQGQGDRVTVANLDRVVAPLGARLLCRLEWRGEGLDRLLDADHAALVEQVVGILQSDGWLVATEVSFSIFGERGSIDILAFHPRAQVLLVIEIKSTVPDVQARLVTLDRKVRLAPKIARERGWSATRVGRLLVIRDDRTSRRRVEQHELTFGTTFPDRSRRSRQWLHRPDPSAPLSGLWFLTGDLHTITRQRIRRPARGADQGTEHRS